MNGEYKIQDMADWSGVDADLVITDPPFGNAVRALALADDLDARGGRCRITRSRVLDASIARTWIAWGRQDQRRSLM